MEKQPPRGREKRVTEAKSGVYKRGEGLGSGPVGGGQSQPPKPAQPQTPAASQSGGARISGTRRGGIAKLLLVLAVLLLGGGGGLGALLGSQQDAEQTALPNSSAHTSSTSSTQSQSTGSAPGSLDLSALLGGLGGGSVSSGWDQEANTGKLDTTVADGARAKLTQLKGSGRDTATIMVYMCGTDLESRSGMGTADLQEMMAADLGTNINLLVYTGGCSGWKNNQVSSTANQIWQVKDGALQCLESNLGSVSMTDPSTLSGYIRWCAKNFPASRYELIFWDHGGGAVGGYGYDEKFKSSGSMGLAAIDTALTDGGVKFDFIGFDACLMATAENALTLSSHGDYLIASEETEPGVGWYYTDWLTAFGRNPSMPTLELGKKIADDFVDECGRKCRGQLTTLSVVDLSELEATLPSRLTEFFRAAGTMISDQEYQAVAQARGNSREFAQSSRIDHVDLVHLARNLGNSQGGSLADTLLGAVKYNRTSSNMTNAYGLSIYFPYQNIRSVDQAVQSYQKIGMDEEYLRCIQSFASVEASGQAVSGGTTSPLSALLGGSGGGAGQDMISQVLGSFLGGDFSSFSGLSGSNSGFLSGKSLSDEDLEQFLTDNRFDPDALVWEENAGGVPAITLEADQWALVQDLDLNLFFDDGEGYIDLGLDNVFSFDEAGGLLGAHDGTWLAIDGQPVAYYHTSTVDGGETYAITGRVPVLHNGHRAELLLAFDNEHPYGYISGVRAVYGEEETAAIAKSDTALEPGDVLEFLCDYYGYDGSYQDSYLLGDPMTVTDAQPEISNVPVEGQLRATYRFTDIYQQHYWTPAMP